MTTTDNQGVRGPSYTPLYWTQVLRPSQLGVPKGQPGVSPSLSQWSLNLASIFNDSLYLAVGADFIYEYRISRSNGISIVPVNAHSIVPPSLVNNLCFSNFPPIYGGPTLLCAGGDASVHNAPGSLSMLRVSSSTSSTSTSTATKCDTFFLTNLKSAWGIDACASTGRVALSTNSYTSVVLQLPKDAPDAAPVLSVQDRTHFGNIPTIAFSRSGRLLASASIDTTFAIFDLSKQSPRSAAHRLLQSRQNDPQLGDAEWCWSIGWIATSTPRIVSLEDQAWQSQSSRRNSFSSLRHNDDPNFVDNHKRAKKSKTSRVWKRRRARAPIYDDHSDMNQSLNFFRDWSSSGSRQMKELPSSSIPENGSHLPSRRKLRFLGPLETDKESQDNEDTENFEAEEGKLEDKVLKLESKDDSDEEDSLFVIARQSTLTLLRFLGGSSWEVLDSVQPFKKRAGDIDIGENTRLCDCIELAELSAILVAEQYHGGMAVVRIVRHGTKKQVTQDDVSQEDIQYKLIVEGIMALNTDGWMAGWAVVRRCVVGVKDDVVYDVFMVDGDGVAEAFELGRQSCLEIHSTQLIL